MLGKQKCKGGYFIEEMQKEGKTNGHQPGYSLKKRISLQKRQIVKRSF